MAPTNPTPAIMTDAGYLFGAPLGTAHPTNTVVGSVFTDAWPVAWIPFGATEEGKTFTNEISVEPITVAEFLDPLAYRTTERTAQMAFALADYTLATMERVYNGGALTVVSGTGATTLTSFEPPDPGEEIRIMLGFESLDNTFRLICRQTINSGSIESQFAKAPQKALLPATFNLEKPASAAPWIAYSAGVTRAGS